MSKWTFESAQIDKSEKNILNRAKMKWPSGKGGAALAEAAAPVCVPMLMRNIGRSWAPMLVIVELGRNASKCLALQSEHFFRITLEQRIVTAPYFHDLP